MVISNVSTTYIKATSAEIADLISNPTNYSKIEVTGTLNCGIVFLQTLAYPFTDTASLLLLPTDSLRFNPQFFGLSTNSITDGIYSITIKLYNIDINQTILIANCGFVDLSISCRVAGLLHNLIGEYQNKSEEQPSTIAHILHYSLVNGNNCGCNCDEMCKNYTALMYILSNIDSESIVDCGCN